MQARNKITRHRLESFGSNLLSSYYHFQLDLSLLPVVSLLPDVSLPPVVFLLLVAPTILIELLLPKPVIQQLISSQTLHLVISFQLAPLPIILPPPPSIFSSKLP